MIFFDVPMNVPVCSHENKTHGNTVSPYFLRLFLLFVPMFPSIVKKSSSNKKGVVKKIKRHTEK